jgi:quercetin dioxygenase-like cupin family protein
VPALDLVVVPSFAERLPITPGGILTRKLGEDERVKYVGFAIDAGEELSDHSATVPAMLVMLEGRATIKLGEVPYEAGPGFFCHMPPDLHHAVVAHEPTRFLLVLLRKGA